MKYIPIEKCDQCPYREHSGGFGSPAYKPRCGKKNKTLPYKVVESHGFMLVAEQKGGIPSWCPLETLKES